MTLMTGMEKAALVIMQMSKERAAEVMRQFSDAEAEELASEIIRLRKVEAGHADAAITEFYERTRTGRSDARGGRDAAALLLEASFGTERAAGLLDRAASAVEGGSFDFLENVDATQLGRVLEGESPEVVALVLAHLSPAVASVVLSAYAPETRVDIAQALAGMDVASHDVIEIVAETLRNRIRAASGPTESGEVRGGVQPLVDIINRADVSVEHALLEALAARDPALADEVRARMLNFDDIVKFDDKDVQQFIRGIDAITLAIALRGASEELVEKVRANMSERNRELLDDEVANLGTVRKAQALEARSQLVRAIRALAADGTIAIHHPEDGDEDEEVEDDVA